MDQIYPLTLDDLIIWPDGTACQAHELDEYTHMSDDYERISVYNPIYPQKRADLNLL